MEALRKRIYDLEALVQDREAQVINAIEALISPNVRGGDEERINQALGILEE